jgi:V8-like Glu-specific endopeptidase
MKKNLRGWPLLGAVLLLWCSGCETGEVLENYDDLTPTITDGVPTNGYPSVGLLSNSCTGTLVGKRSVLTAAHCVTNGGRATFVVGGKRYSSSRVFAHTTGDIALVVLDRDVSNVKPTPLNTSTPKVGQRVTLVGFGQTSENGGGFGTKRMGTNTIDKVDSESIYFRGSGNGRSSNCYGDSGGPAFMAISNQEVVAGVTSGGRAPCGTYAWDTRVDVFVDWLKQKSNGDVLLPGNTSDSSSGVASNDLLPKGQLTKGQYLQSADGSHRLSLQSDGNLVLSRRSDNKTLWATGTSGTSATRFVFQGDGNLVLRTSEGKAVWHSKTAGSGATKLHLHSAGSLVLYKNSTAVWAANGS